MEYDFCLKVINEIRIKDREYKYAETEIGEIIYYKFGNYVQYRNLSERDLSWSIVSEDDFKLKFAKPAVEVYVSSRIEGLDKPVKVVSEGRTYHLARKKKYDNYIYEVDATVHMVFRKSKYPDNTFVYTKYYVPALKMLDKSTLETLKIEAICKFNMNSCNDVSGISAIIDKLYEMIKEEDYL